MTISNYLEEAWLKTVRGGGAGTNFTAPAAVYVKLHTGDPGEDGTANAAGETTRQAATFAAPSNPAGTMTTSADLTWTNVSTSETISHVSVWDANAAGNCLGSGALAASKAVIAGDTS
jgi:hypothetical protein